MNAVSPAPTFAWQRALTTLTVVLLVLVGLYHETGLAMVSIWARSETFAHAFLVPPITLWLIWEKRHVLARQQPRPSLWLALPLAGLGFAWLLGEMAAVNAVTQLAFTCMLILAVPLVIGVPAARLIAFPLGFLLFAVPIGEFLLPKLMDWTAAATVFGLRASGIPVFQEGLHFVIPSGRWSVVEACSGVRYLIASLTVGTLFAYLNYRSTKRRLIFVGIAILVPLVANWIRAYMIVMLGHYSGNKIAVGVDHLIYGWVFFGIVIMIMFVIGMRWSEPSADLDMTVAPASANTSAATTGRLFAASLMFAAVVAAPHAVLWVLTSGATLPPPRLDPQTLATSGWQLAATPMSEWKPAFQNPSGEMNVTLTDGERRVGVYIGYYRQQNYERKLVSSSNVLVSGTDQHWAQVSQGFRTITLDGQAVNVRSGRLRSNVMTLLGQGDTQLVAWHWYWINGHVTTSDYVGKGWLAISRLMGRGDDSAGVVLYAPENQPGGAEAALQDFLTRGGSSIAAILANAKQQR
ncbi:MAG: exosortase A [Gammaproteobacteria bacterium]|nr:exosortase A [Rhodocyclaceae bacterium]MBU3910129.1 exosortase A [Gammaproteobacteria bacterium]MBU3990060.1 exosortase A [Gammaproteobacteria bacterium]MBU4006136.1 exosortase A [Gammaproteobacteria bacterium]MBU4022591.1 exosortase A [Gammaproteobacteria bacterium]